MKRHFVLLAWMLLQAPLVHAECWQAVAEGHPLRFVADQAGAPTRGTFRDYHGYLCLPETDRPGTGNVVIATQSIDVGLPEFNDELRGPLFLDSSRWPDAEFKAESVSPIGPDRYSVVGVLTVRDRSRKVQTELTLERSDGSLRVRASLPILRLDYDLGRGEWADTAWVGNEVTVGIDAMLVRCADDCEVDPQAPTPQ